MIHCKIANLNLLTALDPHTPFEDANDAISADSTCGEVSTYVAILKLPVNYYIQCKVKLIRAQGTYKII